MPDQLTLQPLEQELTFCADELPLLTAQAVLPHWESSKAGRFNRYYGACAQHFAQLCRCEIFPRAEAAYCRARENAAPIPQWQAQMHSVITLRRERLLSLRTDTTVTGLPQRRIGCLGDTWDLQRGFLLSLQDCFPPRAPWRKKLLELAVGQMEEQEHRGLVRCHESWRRDIHRVFHAHRFYLTEEGLCFFFPPGSLAPASEGIPTFCLPYDGQTGPFIPDV